MSVMETWMLMKYTFLVRGMLYIYNVLQDGGSLIYLWKCAFGSV